MRHQTRHSSYSLPARQAVCWIWNSLPLQIGFFAMILAMLVPAWAGAALTPIARTDVVPYQRINQGETFKFGVVAFSKAGISKVDFTISGCGYYGGVKTATAMTLNDRTNVWEYWVPIASTEFSTNGVITVTPKVYGKDGGTRTLDAVKLMVNTTGALAQPKAWVSTTGNDSTGVVNNQSKPFKTIGPAVTAIQAANGGKADGGIVYLSNGTYSLANVNATTTNEWLTIALASGAAKASTIINTGLPTMDKLHVKGITIKKTGSQIFAATNHPDKLWTDGCEVIGSGLWIPLSNPISNSVAYSYFTDSHIYDVDSGSKNTTLMRNSHIEHYGNDALFNSLFVVNTLIEDQNNGTTGWHADGLQMQNLTSQSLPPTINRILYNVKILNVHVQGIVMRADSSLAKDLAFVNVHVEQREPAMPNESGIYSQRNFVTDAGVGWDHFLVWNCSFPHAHSSMNGTVTTNASIVGNLFWDFEDTTSAAGTFNVPWAQNGNSGNNEWLHNHFINAYGLTGPCTKTSQDIQANQPCPHWYAKRPDSGATLTATAGNPMIASNVNPMPQAGSPLLERFPSKVPVDIDNRQRGATSDVGAYERNSEDEGGGDIINIPAGFLRVN